MSHLIMANLNARSTHIITNYIFPKIGITEIEPGIKEQVKEFLVKTRFNLTSINGCGRITETEIRGWCGLEDISKFYEIHSKSKLITMLYDNEDQFKKLENERQMYKSFYDVVDSFMRSKNSNQKLNTLVLEDLWTHYNKKGDL